MFKVSAILFVALVAVNAYDFTDTYFNQFLFEEYEMLNSNTPSRQRRDAEKLNSSPEDLKEVLALAAALPDVSSVEVKEAAGVESILEAMQDPDTPLLLVQDLAPEKDIKKPATTEAEAHPVHVEDPTAAPHKTPVHNEDPTLAPHKTSVHIDDTTTVKAAPVHIETTTAAYVKTSTPLKAAPVHIETTTPAYVKTSTAAPLHVETPAPVKVHAVTEAPEQVNMVSQCGGIMSGMKYDLTCCDANKYDPAYFAMIRGTKKQCAKQLRTNNPDVENFDPFQCPHMEKIKQLIICESECVAKTLNMQDEHGDIKREAIIDIFKKHLTGTEESKIKSFESYVDKCLNKLKGLNMKSDDKCSPVPMEFQHCMFGEMVVGCPAEHQINTTRCKNIRERYSKGASLALGRSTLLDFVHHAKRNNVHSKV